MARAEGKQMSKQNADCICDVCGESVYAHHFYEAVEIGLKGHGWCLQKTLDRIRRGVFDCLHLRGSDMSKENPTPDWDKIKKLAQRMNGLVDEIEKEINDG